MCRMQSLVFRDLFFKLCQCVFFNTISQLIVEPWVQELSLCPLLLGMATFLVPSICVAQWGCDYQQLSMYNGRGGSGEAIALPLPIIFSPRK